MSMSLSSLRVYAERIGVTLARRTRGFRTVRQIGYILSSGRRSGPMARIMRSANRHRFVVSVHTHFVREKQRMAGIRRRRSGDIYSRGTGRPASAAQRRRIRETIGRRV